MSPRDVSGSMPSKTNETVPIAEKAMTMQKNLSGQVITVDENGVHIEITGDQRILKLEIQGISNDVLNEVLNKAIRKSQELAAQELMKVSGGMM